MFKLFQPITTAPALNQAITSTYILDILIGIIFVGLMILAAQFVNNQPGKTDKSYITRRVWFFILLVASFLGSIAFDFFAFYRMVRIHAHALQYLSQMCIASVLAVAVYFGIGFTVIKISRRGTKLNSIFPSKDK